MIRRKLTDPNFKRVLKNALEAHRSLGQFNRSAKTLKNFLKVYRKEISGGSPTGDNGRKRTERKRRKR